MVFQPYLHFIKSIVFLYTNWQFQNAKLEFESELIKASEGGDIKYSIVRPTAFFKSVSGTYVIYSKYVHFHYFDSITLELFIFTDSNFSHTVILYFAPLFVFLCRLILHKKIFEMFCN